MLALTSEKRMTFLALMVESEASEMQVAAVLVLWWATAPCDLAPLEETPPDSVGFGVRVID